jgi:hypothetical protein
MRREKVQGSSKGGPFGIERSKNVTPAGTQKKPGLATLVEQLPRHLKQAVLAVVLGTRHIAYQSERVPNVDVRKHMPAPDGGWSRTLNDSVETQGPRHMVGEWHLSSINDPTYPYALKFANRSGLNLQNFPLTMVLRDVYASGNDAHEERCRCWNYAEYS